MLTLSSLHCHQVYDGIWTWTASKDHIWVHGGPTAPGVCDDVHGLCCHQGSQGSLGSGSPPVAMVGTKECVETGALMIWVVCTAISDHGIDQVLRFWQGPCLGPWTHCNEGLLCYLRLWLPLKILQMLRVRANTWSHLGVWRSWCLPNPTGLGDLCWHTGPYWHPGPKLWLGDISLSVAHHCQSLY